MNEIKIKVLVADDIKLLCEGIKSILERTDDISVIGTAVNGLDAYKKCEILHPDLILMDMKMPEYDGIYGTKMIKAAFPEIKIIILTTFDDSKTINAAIKAGADGYLLKESTADEIVSAIRNVNGNMNIFDKKVFANIKENLFGSENDEQSEDINITNRERDVVKCVVEGMSNKEIAQQLFISEGTVRNTISFLLEKFSVNDRTQLAVFAVKHNLD